MAELEQVLGHLRGWVWALGGISALNIFLMLFLGVWFEDWRRKVEQAEKILNNVTDYASLQRFLWNYDSLSLPVKEELYQRLRNDVGDFAKARTTLDKLFEKNKADPEIQEAAIHRELTIK